MDDWRPDVEVTGEPADMPEGERVALGVPMAHERAVADKTVERLAESAGRDGAEVRRWLTQLEEDGYAERDVDAGLGIEFWRATAKAAELDLD